MKDLKIISLPFNQNHLQQNLLDILYVFMQCSPPGMKNSYSGQTVCDCILTATNTKVAFMMLMQIIQLGISFPGKT
jgi:hypothetical protein